MSNPERLSGKIDEAFVTRIDQHLARISDFFHGDKERLYRIAFRAFGNRAPEMERPPAVNEAKGGLPPSRNRH